MEQAYEYALDAMVACREQERNVYYDDFTHYMEELDVLGGAFIMGKVMLEDVAVDNDKTGRGVLGTIIDFIKRIIAKFINTAKTLFQSNKKWFEQNMHKFDAINDNTYGAMKITLIPYWKINGYDLPHVSIKHDDQRLGDKFKDSTDIEKAMYPNLMKLTVSANIVEGAKIYYRGGSNNLLVVNGTGVKERVAEMIHYCNNYVETANHIKDKLTELQTSIENASTELDKAMEDFSIAEGKPIMETIFATMPWIDSNGEVMYLKEGNTNGTVSNNNNNNNSKPANGTEGNGNNADNKSGKGIEGNGKVVVNEGNGTGGNASGNDEEANKAKQANIGKKTAIKTYFQIQLKVATAMMTIAEERYYAYLRTLKGVLESSGTKVEEKK